MSVTDHDVISKNRLIHTFWPTKNMILANYTCNVVHTKNMHSAKLVSIVVNEHFDCPKEHVQPQKLICATEHTSQPTESCILATTKVIHVQLNIHPSQKKMLVSGTNFCMQNTNLRIVGYW